MPRKRIFLVSAVFIVTFIFFCVYAYNLPKWFPFNSENALREWEEKIFKNRVIYTVEPELDGGFLAAKSKRACSGLMYKIRFYPYDRPMISWRWKVLKFPEKDAETKRKGGWIEKDDYAARVYVIFPSWNLFHIQTLEYVWDENLPEETFISSPYFNKIKLIVVETGKDNLNEWVLEERNICKDYEKAFGMTCRGRRVGAIAIMTDSDNTLSTAEALYKDIKVGYEDGRQK